MHFIVDESAGTAIVEYLRQAGHDVVAIHETKPQAADEEVLDLAAAGNRILVTNGSGKAHSGILLLRLRDESSSNRVRVIRGVVEKHADRLEGNYVVATERGIRVRTSR